MIAFEDYKENIDIVDKFGVLNHTIDKSVVYNGDVHLLTKNKPKYTENKDTPLAAAVLGINNTAIPLPVVTKHYNIWTDIDAQEQYVQGKATCYLILNKPGAGSYILGEAIAKKYNCVHLCPKNIILDEMEQESLTGRCMDLNMRHNKVLKYDTILTLLKMKLESPVIKNRGYVISGIPLVTNSRSSMYLKTSLTSEESVDIMESVMYDLICSIRKKKPKSPKMDAGSSQASDIEQQEEEEQEPEEQEEEGGEEEAEPQLKELPKYILERCSNVIYFRKAYYDTKQSVLLQQLDYLFNLPIKPTIVLYMSCPDTDLVTKRRHKYINYKTGVDSIEPFDKEMEKELRWPEKYVLSDYNHHYDQHIFNCKYQCIQPTNFTENSIDQFCNYKHHLLPFIEKKLKEFDPKNVIKLDARNTINEMMHLITETFIYLPIKPVLIPEPLYLEEPPEDMDEFWKLIEESNVIQDGGVTFNRYASPWFNRCPVELKKGQSTIGNPKFAVSLFKHVYLLSSPDAVISFCRNPKPYLKLKYLEPTCRIITIGTKSSGKTMVCKCLSWLFDVPIICFKSFLETEKRKKYERISLNILSEIIATIEDSRLEKWHNKENERIDQLNLWHSNVLTNLANYIPLLIEILDYDEKLKLKQAKEQLKELKKDSVSSIHTGELESSGETETISTTSDESLIEVSQETQIQYDDLRGMLSFLPFLDNLEMCKSATSDKNICLQYAPLEITTVTETPRIPCLGDEDVTEAIKTYIIANELQKDLEPTVEELMLELVKILSDIDTTIQEITNFEQIYGKYIIDDFPSDPEYWGYLSDSKLLPDYTIAIIENREIDADILQHYTNIEMSPKCYIETIMQVDDPLMNIKRRTKDISVTASLEMQMIVDDLIKNASDQLYPYTTAESENTPKDDSPSFAESIDKFREDWDSIKIRLEEKSKVFIEVEIDNKTDVNILEEVLLKIRYGYCAPPEVTEGEDAEPIDEDEDGSKDLRTYNPPQFLGETNIYCPVAYHKHAILWEGKPEFSIKHKNVFYYFANEECLEEFKKDITRYQFHNFPCKQLPSLKICVVGSMGSGKTTVSKFIAKELGLLHIDFSEAVNEYLMPRHIKKVGRQYENAFTDTPIDEEGVVDFQMGEENENLIAEILGNETELRRMVYSYFERGTPLVPVLMQKLIKKLWCEEPFFSTGFVLDGFPRLPNEIEDMMACYCIPDLVIQLDTNVEISLKRLSNPMFKMWKNQQNEAKAQAKAKFDIEKQEWLNGITKTVVAQLICEEILDNVFFFGDDLTNKLSVGSAIIDAHPSGDINIDARLFQAYNTIVEENPAPIDQSEWEKSDEARERIEARLESIFEVDDENIQSLNEALTEQKIKIVNINGSKPLNKVLRVALSKLTNLRNRCESFFEQTFIISNDIAEMLLLRGFYSLSKHNRMDPVHIFENPNAISCPYKISKNKSRIFTVLHRAHIYFIGGVDNLMKFRRNPLMYLKDANFDSYFEYPLRIAIIGPPKSGKSTLAAKIAKKYGLVCVSKGMALRHVLENMNWTELASKILRDAREGECVNSDIMIKAVQVVVVDHRVNTHGFVFDGIPETASEARELVQIGLYPLIIFDINANQDTIIANSQKEYYYDILKYKPPYCRPFIEYRFEQWQKFNYSIRDWVKDDYQNLYITNGNISKWLCFQESENTIKCIVSKVNQYLKNVNSDNVVSASVMCISNEIFQRKMSPYINLCPLCLNRNILRHSGFPVDRKGIVQFRDKFFWICNNHMDEVMNSPETYLTVHTVHIPEVPAVIKTVDATLAYENGICIVTYAENLPSQKIVRGSNKFAASYRGTSYLFCGAECLEKFLAKPHNYFDVTVFRHAKDLPTTTLNKLPNLGYLEQTVGNIITNACCTVNALRPKYPGLNIDLSALVYIGLFLKSHNPKFDKCKQDLYLKKLKIYEARCRLMIDVGLRLRSRDNPFVVYPKCCGDMLKREDSRSLGKSPSIISSHSTRRVPVPDERYDYLCEYHKPVSKVPAFLNVVDIAGLVRGAAEGQGLGNAFLSHIKACDAIFNLCRAFEEEEVIHVDGDVNPIRDLETIGEELRLKDEEQLMQNFEKLDRVVNRGGDKKLKSEYDALNKIKAILVDEKKHIRFGDWSAAEIEILNKYLFLTSKPALYLVNLSEKDYIRKKNKWLPKLKEWIDKNDPGAPLIPFSGVLETKLMEMEPEEKKAYLKEHNITSALDKIIVAGYKALQLEYFFTAGPDEVKAWTILKGTKAPQAAGRIHTDFEKGFIMAEVMHYKDFKEEGSEAACKSAGKYRQQGRNYVVEDGDIIFFKFNAGAGLKDAKKK